MEFYVLVHKEFHNFWGPMPYLENIYILNLQDTVLPREEIVSLFENVMESQVSYK